MNRPLPPGDQWVVWLAKRTPGTEDNFPLGADGARWVCGARREGADRC